MKFYNHHEEKNKIFIPKKFSTENQPEVKSGFINSNRVSLIPISIKEDNLVVKTAEKIKAEQTELNSTINEPKTANNSTENTIETTNNLTV